MPNKITHLTVYKNNEVIKYFCLIKQINCILKMTSFNTE